MVWTATVQKRLAGAPTAGEVAPRVMEEVAAALAAVDAACGAVSVRDFAAALMLKVKHTRERWLDASLELERQEHVAVTARLAAMLRGPGLGPPAGATPFLEGVSTALRASLLAAAEDPDARIARTQGAAEIREATVYLQSLVDQATSATSDVERLGDLIARAEQAAMAMRRISADVARSWTRQIHEVQAVVIQRLREGADKMGGLIAFVEHGLRDYELEVAQQEQHHERLRESLFRQAVADTDSEDDAAAGRSGGSRGPGAGSDEEVAGPGAELEDAASSQDEERGNEASGLDDEWETSDEEVDDLHRAALAPLPLNCTPRGRRRSLDDNHRSSTKKPKTPGSRSRRLTADLASPAAARMEAAEELLPACHEDPATKRGKVALQRERKRQREREQMFEAVLARKHKEKQRRRNAVESFRKATMKKTGSKRRGASKAGRKATARRSPKDRAKSAKPAADPVRLQQTIDKENIGTLP